MKDEARLQQWEEIVNRVKNYPNARKATRHKYICSRHFEREDYILPPSEASSCRLKRNATPSLFKLTCHPLSHKTTEDSKCRAEMHEDNLGSKKRSMPQDSGVRSKKSKVNINHGKIFKQSEIMEISNKQLKAKVRNLQQ